MFGVIFEKNVQLNCAFDAKTTDTGLFSVECVHKKLQESSSK